MNDFIDSCIAYPHYGISVDDARTVFFDRWVVGEMTSMSTMVEMSHNGWAPRRYDYKISDGWIIVGKSKKYILFCLDGKYYHTDLSYLNRIGISDSHVFCAFDGEGIDITNDLSAINACSGLGIGIDIRFTRIDGDIRMSLVVEHEGDYLRIKMAQ